MSFFMNLQMFQHLFEIETNIFQKSMFIKLLVGMNTQKVERIWFLQSGCSCRLSQKEDRYTTGNIVPDQCEFSDVEEHSDI